ncbi:MAG: hypothetical protein ACKVJU_12275 [Verrucomicrobiales bacterium]
MADPKPEPKKTKKPVGVPASRMLERWRIFGHVVFQTVLMFVIFGQLNYLSCKKHATWDMTQNRKFTLQETTRNVVKGLDEEVKIVMAFLGSSDLFLDVKGLVTRYGQVGGDRVPVEILDLSRSKDRLAELRDEYGLQFSKDEIILISADGRIKAIGAEELVRRDPQTNRVKEFRGEEILTSALLEVTEEQQRKVYLVAGDRAAEQIMRIGAQFQKLASSQNARVETLILEGAMTVPADAEALIFAGNTVDISQRELEMVTSFWKERHGGLLIFLDPAADTPNLTSLLREHGVAPNDDRVLSVQSIPGVASRKIRNVPVGVISNIDGTGRGPDLPSMSILLNERSQSLTVQNQDPAVRAKNIWPSPLMVASRGFWGETEYELDEAVFDEVQDNKTPVWLGASVEVGKAGDSEMKSNTSRLVVVGNGNVIDPVSQDKVSADFAMAALNWVINRESLAGISPRQPSEFTLSITPAQTELLQTLIVFGLPAIALFIGAFVWYRRRA